MNITEIINFLQTYFEEKARVLDIQMAFLYGSWSKGYPRMDSDIDVAIVLEDDKPSEEATFEIVNTLTLSLGEHLNREVNVLLIHQDFAKPMLFYNAIILGRPVFIKDQAKYARLINDAIYQMEDFSIFGKDWQIAVAEKNLKAIKSA